MDVAVCLMEYGGDVSIRSISGRELWKVAELTESINSKEVVAVWILSQWTISSKKARAMCTSRKRGIKTAGDKNVWVSIAHYYLRLYVCRCLHHGCLAGDGSGKLGTRRGSTRLNGTKHGVPQEL